MHHRLAGREAIRREAEHYPLSGADVIDIGCTPGASSPTSARWCASSCARDAVSQSTRSTRRDRAAVAAGSEAGPQRQRSNRDVGARAGRQRHARRVIPISARGSRPGTERRRASSGGCRTSSTRHRADRVRVHCARSSGTRRRGGATPVRRSSWGSGISPSSRTADTTGVNALLLAVCQELGVRAVLTTEVIPWARGAVREIDIARRLMYPRSTHKRSPRASTTARDGERPGDSPPTTKPSCGAPPRRHGPELPHLHRRDTITVFNNERFVRGTDIHEIFAQLDGTNRPTPSTSG